MPRSANHTCLQGLPSGRCLHATPDVPAPQEVAITFQCRGRAVPQVPAPAQWAAAVRHLPPLRLVRLRQGCCCLVCYQFIGVCAKIDQP